MKWKITFPHRGASFRALMRDGTQSLLRDVVPVGNLLWVGSENTGYLSIVHKCGQGADEAFPFGFEVASFLLKGSQAVWVHLP